MSYDVCVAICRHDDFHIGSCQSRDKSFDKNMSLFCGDADSAYLITLGGKGFLSQTGEASFGLLSDRQVCDMVMTLFHELRHVSQYEHIASGHDIGREVEAGIIIGDYDYSYYQNNHHLLAHEYDAESYGVVEAFDVLREAWGDARATRAMTMSLRNLRNREIEATFHPAISLVDYDVDASFDVDVYKQYVTRKYDESARMSRTVDVIRYDYENRFVPERLNLFTGTCMRYGLHSVEFDETEPGVSQDIYVASAICATSDEAACAHPGFEGVPVTVSERARERHAELVADYERKRGSRTQSGTLDDVDRDAIGRAALKDAADMRAVSDDFARDFGP